MFNFTNIFNGIRNRLFGDKKRLGNPGNWDKTIAIISPYWHADPDSSSRQEAGDVLDGKVEQRVFKIRLAHSHERVNSASILVQRKYASRGLESSHFQRNPGRITLMAFQGNKVTGTLTLGLDSTNGLLADELYKTEIDCLRMAGHKVCELTKLAIDQPKASKRVLAALFHIAYIYGRVMQGYTDVVIEVNPRHVSFYKRMLGFKEFGPERLCGRVNAPAVLLRLEIDYVDQQIELLGGKTESAGGERSLYPYFFAKKDEIGICNRLARGEAQNVEPAICDRMTRQA
jgi:hypothetical protein